MCQEEFESHCPSAMERQEKPMLTRVVSILTTSDKKQEVKQNVALLNMIN
jgi:hypothetical protein